ncbi:hypothetical protein JNUCC23_09640 [Peribacillus sp. JNUCC 23]
MKSGHISQFTHLSQFTSLIDFNNHFEQHMVDYKASFTKGELVALRRLVRFSASIPGICNAKIQTIVAATHTNESTGISRSTFKRMLNKAVELGLLVIHNTFKNGKLGHSVYVFNRYQSGQEESVKLRSPNVPLKEGGFSISNYVEPSKQEILNQQETVILSKTNNIKNNKRTEMLSTEFTSDNVPQDFTELASIHFKDARTIEKLWSKVNMAAYPFCFEVDKAMKVKVGIVSLRQVIRAMKVKDVRDKFGYFYGVLENKFRDEYFEDITENGFSLVG